MWNSDEEYHNAMMDQMAGHRGSLRSGSAHNFVALHNYEVSKQPNAAGQPQGVGGPTSYGGGTSSGELEWMAFPTILILLGGGIFTAERLYDWTGSWWVVGFVGVLTLALVEGLYLFFQTPLGKRVQTVLGWLAFASFLGLIAWSLYQLYQWEGVFWFAVVIGTPIALGLLMKGMEILFKKTGEVLARFFTQTKTGQVITVWTKRVLAGSAVLLVSYGAFALWRIYSATA